MSITTTLHPAEWLHQMRQEKPVHYDPDMTFFWGGKGAWQLFRYEDVRRALSDAAVFSAEYIPLREGGGLGNSIAMTDPPRHDHLRALVNKAFIPSVLEPMEAWIRRYCEQLLHPHTGQGRIDFISDFAAVLPAAVIARFIGIPEIFHSTIKSWTRILIGDPTTIGMEAYTRVETEMGGYIQQLAEERKAVPEQDLLSQLVQADLGGQQLSMDDVVAFCVALLAGGTETIGALLGNAVRIFVEQPYLQEHLFHHPEELSKAINEVLRLRSPVLSMSRITRQEVELDGLVIRRGSLVNCWIAAANLDPAVFADPDTYDMERDHSRSIAFGYGIHHCIGSFLARLEARVAFETIFSSWQKIRFIAEEPLQREPNNTLFKYSTLPVAFKRR